MIVGTFESNVILESCKEEEIMRKNLGAKPFLYPQVVMIIAIYDENGTPDAMNAAYWSLGEKVGKAFSDGSKLK